jgi:hypothetical protein
LKDQNNLGDPAEVLLLRESKIHRYDHGGIFPDNDDAELDAEHIDILEQMKEERGLVSEEEVQKNFNEFKPVKDQEPKSWDEFNGLVQRLQESFTVPQLERYIRTFGKSDSSSHTVGWTPLSSDAVHEVVLESSPWVPEVGEYESQNNKQYSRGYTLASHTAKQRAVIQLIRECWKLTVPELETGIGSMEVRMRVTDLNLLSSKSPTSSQATQAN